MPATANRNTRQRKRPQAKPKEAWHGTVNGYQWHGCRCAACTHAMTSYQAGYRNRRFEGKTCSNGCNRVASKAAGNGLCYKCHAEKKKPRAKKRKKATRG